MNYPIWQLDSFGGGLWVILIAVFHVYIAHFAVGGGLFLVLAERKAEREHDPAMLDYVRRHAKFFLLLTMVAGSITGVGIWFIIALLNPAATSILIHTFVFAWAMEWVFFLLEIVSLFLYASTFGRMAGWRHRLLGWIYFVSAWMSLFLINGIIDFMLTPGTWPQDGTFWSGFFNPSFWPSLFSRTFLSLIIAGLFGLVTATWLRKPHLRTTMVRFCARWLLMPFVLFAAAAWWYQMALPPELREMIFARMPSMRPFFNGLLLGSPILVLAGLLIFRLPTVLGRILSLGLLVVGQLYIGCFECIREGGRRPYIIRDVMYSTSILQKDMDRIQDQGLLSQAKWVRNREITAANRLEAGQELYNLLCLSCHAIDGPVRDIRKLAAPFTPTGLDAMISGMHILYPVMPPFAGTAEERAALAAFIAEGLNGRHDPAPVDVQKKQVDIPAFDAKRDPYVLLAWSPVGMRSVAEVKGVLSLLPPGNELRAQLIRRGETPEIINQGVTLTYRLETSAPGDPPPSPAVSGELMVEDDVFVAADIGLHPWSAQGFDPYPVLRIEARDGNDGLLATTKVVAPVSSEVGCSTCHGASPELGDRPGLGRETAFNILAVHDRLSGTTLRKQARKGSMIQCRRCHADVPAKTTTERLNLSAAIHGFHALYLRERGGQACALCHPSAPTGSTRMLRDLHASMDMDCTSCHGVLEDQALALLKKEHQAGKQQAHALMQRLAPRAVSSVEEIRPRSPWVQQPDCLHCHVGYQAPASDTLVQSWTGGEQDLYRNRTDDSGRLSCAACHSSTHAVYPANNPYGAGLDVLQPLQYQGNHLPMGANRNCRLCHTVDMEEEMHHPNSLRDFRNE